MPESVSKKTMPTQRQSIAERLADLQAQRQETLEQLRDTQFSNPLEEFIQAGETAEETITSTVLHASLFGEQFYAEPVLTVTQAGALQAADVVAAVELFQVSWEDAKPFDPQLAVENHLLLLDTEVDPRELEALAVSIWEQARWAGPGELFLFEGAKLRGPFKISPADATALQIPPEYQQIWTLEVTPERALAGPVIPGVVNIWEAHFGNLQPAGAELGALNAVLRMAKRLAGAVRVATEVNPGQVQQPLEPDPESAVNLRVYAPRWLDEADLSALLKGYFPDLTLTNALGKGMEQAKLPATREELELAKEIPEDEVESIADITESADAKAHQGLLDYQPYAMRASAGNRSQVEVAVAKVNQYLPMAVRHQPWPGGTAVEYTITWIPKGQGPYSSFTVQTVADTGLGMSRSLRLERSRVRAEVDKIALLLAKTTSGVILDEDGFLIAE